MGEVCFGIPNNLRYLRSQISDFKKCYKALLVETMHHRALLCGVLKFEILLLSETSDLRFGHKRLVDSIFRLIERYCG